MNVRCRLVVSGRALLAFLRLVLRLMMPRSVWRDGRFLGASMNGP
jgi:hypothetical protein